MLLLGKKKKQLGRGSKESSDLAVKAELRGGVVVVDAACGQAHVLARVRGQEESVCEAWAWGRSDHGQCGFIVGGGGVGVGGGDGGVERVYPGL
jgi:hypothetical protein